MATTKKATTTKKKTTDTKKPLVPNLEKNEVLEYLKYFSQCSKCGRILDKSKNFYMSYSKDNVYSKRMNICKECLGKLLEEYIFESQSILTGIYRTCRATNIYFTEKLFNEACDCVEVDPNKTLTENGMEIWKVYIKNCNSLPQNTGKSFDQGQQLGEVVEIKEREYVNIEDIIVDDMSVDKELEFQRNKADIIKMLGYYPFENEDSEDLLCGQLITFLGDEEIKDDAIKLNAIISIIRNQRAVDVISKSLAEKTKDFTNLENSLGTIKQMTVIQKDLSKTILDTAKDNKLTDMWSGKKTAGASTLTGMLSKLRSINLDDVQVNLFDIRTAKGIEQVAIQSAKGIVENLNWSDDTAMEMIKEQRILIDQYYKQYMSLKEENRKLKVICHLNNVDYTTDNYIDEVEWKDLKPSEDLTTDDVAEMVKKYEEHAKAIEEEANDIQLIGVCEYADNIIEKEKTEQKQKLIDAIKESAKELK